MSSTPRATSASTSAHRPFPSGIERGVSTFSRPLTWLWSRGFRFLGVLDAIALYGLMVAISVVRTIIEPGWATLPTTDYVIGFAVATAIHVSVNYFTGLYEREPRLGRKPWLPKAFLATGIGAGVQSIAFVALDRYLMPRWNLVAFVALASFVLIFNRNLSRRLAVRRQGPARVVLAGDAETIETTVHHLAESDRSA
ncbi:MAG: hypothetical protein AB8G26_17845, partial [Ilumatobacter sp.]